MTRPTTRREFISEVAAGAAIAALAADVLASQQPAAATGLPTRAARPDGRARVDSLPRRLAHRVRRRTRPRRSGSCTPRSMRASPSSTTAGTTTTAAPRSVMGRRWPRAGATRSSS